MQSITGNPASPAAFLNAKQSPTNHRHPTWHHPNPALPPLDTNLTTASQGFPTDMHHHHPHRLLNASVDREFGTTGVDSIMGPTSAAAAACSCYADKVWDHHGRRRVSHVGDSAMPETPRTRVPSLLGTLATVKRTKIRQKERRRGRGRRK
ncbi:hypothetical protein Ancab_003713 [Ancistrocladus abbreviatus]